MVAGRRAADAGQRGRDRVLTGVASRGAATLPRESPLRRLHRSHGNAYVSRVVQRRLVLRGAAEDVEAFLRMLGSSAGLELAKEELEGLAWRVTSRVADGAVSRSPTLRRLLQTIVEDAGRDASAFLGHALPGVEIGAFPDPPDLSGSRTQLIDVGNVLRAEEQLEGAGAALAAHELWENYLAQGLSPAQHSQYEAPHEHAVLVEQAVGTELLGGGRLAVVSEDETIGGTKVEHVLYDHGSFFVELTFARSSDEVDAVQRLVSVRPRRALTAQAGRPVVFAPDSSVLSPQARWKLRAVRRMLEGAGPVTVRLTSLAGVADTAATRTRFSLERAEAVAEQILLGEDDESDRVHIRLGDDIEPEPRVEIEMAWPEPDPQVGAGPEADVAREPAPDNAADGPRVPDAEGGST